MAEIITELEEEELTRKLKAKKRVRGLLIVINFLLLSYLLVNIGISVKNLIESANNIDGVVALTDRNQKESLEIYKQYVNNDNVIGGDFAIYGDEIFFTKDSFDKNNLNFYENIQLLKIETNKKNTIKDISLYYDLESSDFKGINLFNNNSNTKLAKGDYLFYVDAKSIDNMGKVIKIDNGLDMKYELYSFPDEYGQRVKATLYAYNKNPALVLNIDYVSSIPEEHYDVVVIGTEEHYESIKNSFDGLKVKHLITATDVEAYAYHTQYIVKLIDEDKTNTENLVYKHYLYQDNSNDPFINAMAGYANSEGLPYQYNSEHFMGKNTYVVDLLNESVE